ncbi:MAG: hypothetical protein JXB04_05490 [Kiritimatiellae bacterium]|nr:hypothetical protein [Kiritimatiellia bacterium]
MTGTRMTGVLMLCAALARAAAGEEAPTLTGFRVPEYDQDGKLNSELFGDLAQFQPDGIVKISNLRIDFYKGTGVEMRVTAPECNYNEKKKEAESDSSVRIARDNMVVTGVGFVWKAGRERLEIFNEAKVVLKEARHSMQAKEAREEEEAQRAQAMQNVQTGEEP